MFPPETRILLASGNSRRIDALAPGDLVVSHTGWPRAVLRLYSAEWTGKLLKFKPGSQSFLVCSDDTRWLFSGNRGLFSATVASTGNSDCLVGIPVVSKGELTDQEAVYCRLVDCSYAKAKTRRLYAIDVEEEHSFAVVPEGGKTAVFVRS